jgi:hypothetical protein
MQFDVRPSRGFALTEGDIDILSFVHDFRLLRIEQLEALTGLTYTAVHRRVKGLFDGHFLTSRAINSSQDSSAARQLFLYSGM